MGEQGVVSPFADSPDEVAALSEEVAAFLPEPSDEDVRGEVVLYRNEQGALVVELVQRDGQVWLTQAQIAELYQTSRANIAQHLKKIYDEGEIVMQATCKYYLQVQNEGSRAIERKIKYYNLEAILAVGYRVRSPQGVRFRQWATQHLSEYLLKGFTMDDERLTNLGGGVYWTELLNRIRDIRASEKVSYRQVLDLFATSPDYDQNSEVARDFFSRAQDMFDFAVHGHTAAEVVLERIDASKPYAGLTSFKGEQPCVEDAMIAKNYLNEDELGRLRLKVSAYFDAAELRARMHQPTFMKDWMGHLETMIAAMGGELLEGKGSHSHEQMKKRVREEMAKYRERTKDELSRAERDSMAALASVEAAAKEVSR